MSFDPNIGYKQGLRSPWNKGLTKDTSVSVANISKKLISNIAENKICLFGGKSTNPSKETRDKLSIIAKNRKLGGSIRKSSIKFSKIDGTIVILDSSYELRVAQELELNNISWIRPESMKWIDEQGNDHAYYPDFYLTEFDVFLDPKNDFLIKQDQDKIKRVQEQNNVKVFILDKHQLSWKEIKRVIDVNGSISGFQPDCMGSNPL